MRKYSLLFALASLLVFGGCTSSSKSSSPQPAAQSGPDAGRNFDPQSERFQRPPPYGARVNQDR